MEIPSGLAAFAVIAGIAYWINSSREEKRKWQGETAASQEARKKHEKLLQTREKARNAIRSRAKEFDVDYADDELDWICSNAEAHSGEKGLADIGNVFATAPRSTVEKLMMKIEKDHLIYLADQQAEQQSAEKERQWQTVLDDFRRLNPAQQKSHLTYLKKHHTDELTDEQLHILELVSLGEVNTPKSKDIEVGGVKLFTMKEK